MKTKKETIKIRQRETNEVLFESTTATTIKEAVVEAVKQKVDLWKADLWKADLRGAELSEANLWKADLREADLRKANLREANLWKTNLREADLSRADLVCCRMDKKVFKQITEELFEWDVIDEA